MIGGILIFLSSCSLLGIHFQVHNPNRPGKPEKFDREAVLLGDLNKYRTAYDAHYYDLSLEVFPEDKDLSGVVEIHANAVRDFDTIQIDLHQNFLIESITEISTGKTVSYSKEERAIWLALTKKKGEQFVIQVKYSGKPPKAKKPPWKGGFVWKKDMNKDPWIGVACESEGASVWWPLKDHTSDEPDSMRMHYTVPKDLVAIGNGQFEGEELRENTKVYNWFVSYPINTYNVSIYVGKFKLLEDNYTGNSGKELAITHYVLEENYDKAKKHFKQLIPQLKSFEKYFGEYPWYRDGFKLVESPYAGMEHQTAIAYGNGYKNDHNNTDYIILHETAHEWWGNSITAKDLAHVWLQEGFATYAESLYFEDVFSKETGLNHLYFYKWFIKNKYPLVGVEDRRWFHFRKGADAYMKGAWVLQSLRNQINNDTLFFDIIKSFHVENAREIVVSQDFVNHVNEKTKSDYSWFFNHYLYNNESPSLSYYIDDNGMFYYQWNNVKDDFTKLKITIGVGRKLVQIIPTKSVQKLQLPLINESYEVRFSRDVLFEKKKMKKLAK